MTHTSVPPQTNHTPGPWSISFQTTGERQLWQCADIGNRDKGAHIVSVEWAGPDYGGTLKTIGEAHANAHLIAAAPELLAALERVEWIPEGGSEGRLMCAWCYEHKQAGHTSDCQRQSVLAAAKGGPVRA